MGKLISTIGSLADTVGAKNPYRYRGYRYDTETGLYYLQSRYFNPEWGRFINADEIGNESGISNINMYTYCNNDPVNLSDFNGNIPIANIIGAIVGAGLGGILGKAIADHYGYRG